MENRKHHINIIFIAILAGIFAVLSILIAILGVNVYKTASAEGSDRELAYAFRFATQKVRESGDSSEIRTASIGGSIPALVISFEENDKKLETWLFSSDGEFKETTVAAGSAVSLTSGRNVVKMKSSDFDIADNLLTIDFTADDGTSSSLQLYIPKSEGGIDE